MRLERIAYLASQIGGAKPEVVEDELRELNQLAGTSLAFGELQDL